MGESSLTAVLRAGDRIVLGWGGELGPGICPFRLLVGGHLCIEIRNPARLLGSTAVEVDPQDPTRTVATMDLLVSPSRLGQLHLQAMSLRGPAWSA